MDSRRLSLRAALVLCAGIASSALLAPAVSAQTDSTQSAQGIRGYLSVKQWYVTFTVELDCPRGGDSRYRSLTRGMVGLDLRNQGPAILARPGSSGLSDAETRRAIQNPGSLTRAQLEALARQSAGYLEQIDNAANWMRGPESIPPDLVDQNDPRWLAWLDSTAVDRLVEYHFNSPDLQVTARGAGRVLTGEVTRFEVDVAQKKYVVAIPVAFGDQLSTVNAVHVTERRRTEHGWETQTSEHGLTGGNEPTFSKIDPVPWDIGHAYVLEGALPEAVGPVSGQKVFRVDPYTGNLDGTLTISWTVSPTPPQPVELVIEKPADYATWRPLGLDDEEETGNTIAVTAKLRKPGGGDPPFKAGRIAFRLIETSKVPGVCMNYPRLPRNPSPFDLRFEHARNPDLLLDDAEGQGISRTGGDLVEATAVLSSFDYGGHAKLQVTAELENGDVVVGVVEGTADERSLRLPSRPIDSHVADVYLDRWHAAGEADDSDVDDDPVGDHFKGDGLTLYEEYRGFMENGEWIETDPSTKDYFVRNKCSGHGPSLNGVRMFEDLSEFDVHGWLLDDEMRTDGTINFNHGTEPHVVDQHGITIFPTDNPRRGFANVDAVGTPGTAKKLHMPMFTWPTFARPSQSGNSNGRTQWYAVTMAHELMHASNVYHHGEGDLTVTWRVFHPPLLDPFVTESLVNRVKVLNEDGSPVDPAIFGNDPVELSLGIDHGQHSGVEDCVMRYDCSVCYVSAADPSVRYFVDEPIGTKFCSSIVGSGVNAAGRRPQPRYSNAAAGGAVPGVVAQRGNCRAQLRVNDLGQEPAR